MKQPQQKKKERKTSHPIVPSAVEEKADAGQDVNESRLSVRHGLEERAGVYAAIDESGRIEEIVADRDADVGQVHDDVDVHVDKVQVERLVQFAMVDLHPGSENEKE
jgi:hypothetical protein